MSAGVYCWDHLLTSEHLSTMDATLRFTAVDANQVGRYIGERATQALGSVASQPPPERKTPLLFLHRLVKGYGVAIAVNELSLTLERGHAFGFLVPNAARKTPTIRLFITLTRPTPRPSTL